MLPLCNQLMDQPHGLQYTRPVVLGYILQVGAVIMGGIVCASGTPMETRDILGPRFFGIPLCRITDQPDVPFLCIIQHTIQSDDVVQPYHVADLIPTFRALRVIGQSHMPRQGPTLAEDAIPPLSYASGDNIEITSTGVGTVAQSRQDRLVQIARPRGTADKGMYRRGGVRHAVAMAIARVAMMPQPRGSVLHGFHFGQREFPTQIRRRVRPSALVECQNHEHPHIVLVRQSHVGDIALVARALAIPAGRVRPQEVIMQIDVIEGIALDDPARHVRGRVGGESDVCIVPCPPPSTRAPRR